jgi:hypothetical protein
MFKTFPVLFPKKPVMKIVLVYRSKKLGYHSIENVFGSVQRELMAKGDVETVYVENRGFSFANLVALRKFVKKSSV